MPDHVFPAELPPLRWRLSQEQIDTYAAVSGASDPIHVDPAFARTTRFGGTVAQGLLIFASLSELFMTGLPDPRGWVNGGRLVVAFRAPARPGDALAVGAGLVAVTERDGGRHGDYDVWCENGEGSRIVLGRAVVPAPPPS